MVNKSTQPYVPDKAAAAKAAKYDFKAGSGQSMVGAGASASASAAGSASASGSGSFAKPTTDVQLVGALLVVAAVRATLPQCSDPCSTA